MSNEKVQFRRRNNKGRGEGPGWLRLGTARRRRAPETVERSTDLRKNFFVVGGGVG
ncbi:hypothetical protein IQ07DRAFT_582595, partial [Pyrenochaeta sp. DS3sAY3a]